MQKERPIQGCIIKLCIKRMPKYVFGSVYGPPLTWPPLFCIRNSICARINFVLEANETHLSVYTSSNVSHVIFWHHALADTNITWQNNAHWHVSDISTRRTDYLATWAPLWNKILYCVCTQAILRSIEYPILKSKFGYGWFKVPTEAFCYRWCYRISPNVVQHSMPCCVLHDITTRAPWRYERSYSKV